MHALPTHWHRPGADCFIGDKELLKIVRQFSSIDLVVADIVVSVSIWFFGLLFYCQGWL